VRLSEQLSGKVFTSFLVDVELLKMKVCRR